MRLDETMGKHTETIQTASDFIRPGNVDFRIYLQRPIQFAEDQVRLGIAIEFELTSMLS